MDMAIGARRRTTEVAHNVAEKAPSVHKAVTEKAADALRDIDVPETIRDVAQKVGDSEGAKKVKKVAKQAAMGLDTNAG